MGLLSDSQISDFCLKLSTLLHAGMDISQSAMLLHPKDGTVKQVVAALSQGSDDGLPLYEILESTGVFPSYVTGLVRTGEMSGKTEDALAALSEYYDRQDRRKRQIKAAITYPAVLLAMMIGVVIVLLVRVLPVFASVYRTLGGSMTGFAGGMLSLGNWIRSVLPVLFWVLIVMLVSVLLAVSIKRVRHALVFWYQKRFGDKGVLRKVNNAKVAQALAMGLESGQQLEDAMELAASLMKDVPAAAGRCQVCADRLRGDMPLSEALQTSGVLSDSACELLFLGQQGGNGDDVMQEIARRMETEAEDAIDRLVARVEPVLVLSTSLLVGLILFSVMLPLMDIMSVLG